MKRLFALAVLSLFVQSALADTEIIIGQGKSGDKKESSPTEKSVKQCLEIYKAVETKVMNDPDSAFEMEFEKDSFNITLDKAKHEVEMTVLGSAGKLYGVEVKIVDITFSGPAADFLAKNLRVRDTGRIGLLELKAGNLTCSKSATLNPKVVCKIEDTTAAVLD